MRIIVSTKTFRHSIVRALRQKTKEFNILGEKNEIIFTGTRTQYVYITPVVGHEKFSHLAEFDYAKWFKIQQVLKELPEQPISIEFNTNGEIKLSQFVMIF